MTYGFRPENWPAFRAELDRRGLTDADIEKVEIRPDAAHPELELVTLTLHSGRVESWRQPVSGSGRAHS